MAIPGLGCKPAHRRAGFGANRQSLPRCFRSLWSAAGTIQPAQAGKDPVGEDMTPALDQLFGLKGRVAVVTGGASGIGLASAELLAAAGASVVIVDRDHAAAQHALKNIGNKGLALAVDVAKESEIEAAVADVARQLGRIDILVNSAGTAIRRPAVE